MMQPDTLATLQALEAVDWFHAIGRRDSQRAKILSSWMEAIASCAAPKWEEIQQEAMYIFRQRALDALRETSAEQRREQDLKRIREEITQGGGFVSGPPPLPELFPEWDEIQQQVRPAVVSLVQLKTRDVVAKEGLPDVFVERATWDILYLAMECEFSRLVSAGFYTAISFYYANGHFPCGWEGAYPTGRLIVY